jgi:hypothetical protein
VDEVNVSSTTLNAYDLGIRTALDLPVVVCTGPVEPVLEVRNYGFSEINSYSIQYGINNQVNTINYEEQNLISGASAQVARSFAITEERTYDLSSEVGQPNQQPDEQASNNVVTHHLVVDNTHEQFPFREDFEDPTPWIVTNAGNNPIWEPAVIDNRTTLLAPGYNQDNLETRHWIVSPLINVEEVEEASLRFRYAYGHRPGFRDRFQVLLSADCGRKFDWVLFDRSGADLSPDISPDPFIPDHDSLWREVSLDLTPYMFLREIRIAFVFENGGGNNFYLDEAEFYLERDPPTFSIDGQVTVYPNPVQQQSFKVGLRLNQRIPELRIDLIDLSGKIVLSRMVENALNQTLEFVTPTLKGTHFLRLSSKDFQETRRLLISR